jgi:hypothetical protein
MPQANSVFVRYLDGSSETIAHQSLALNAFALTIVTLDGSRITIPIGRIAFTRDNVVSPTVGAPTAGDAPNG